MVITKAGCLITRVHSHKLQVMFVPFTKKDGICLTLPKVICLTKLATYQTDYT